MSRSALIARPIAENEHDRWDVLVVAHGSIFDSGRWAGLFGDSIRRIGIFDAGGSLRGGFCLYLERHFGFRVLRNPPYTPQIGPFYEARATNPAARTNEQRGVVQAMADYLGGTGAAVISLGLSPVIRDCLPFYWRKWKVVPHYTYRIDLTQTEDGLLTAMSPERRKNIRKSQMDGVSVVGATGIEEMRALVIGTFNRQNKTFPLETMNKVLSEFHLGNNSYCFISKENEKPVSGVYVVHDSQTAYYLMGGYANGGHHGAGALAMWHAILKARELGLKVFDFEGSMVPSIEKYFRGFGGILTPCFTVNKAWLPVEMAMKLIRRQRF